jgi:hypothetical protein
MALIKLALTQDEMERTIYGLQYQVNNYFESGEFSNWEDSPSHHREKLIGLARNIFLLDNLERELKFFLEEQEKKGENI